LNARLDLLTNGSVMARQFSFGHVSIVIIVNAL
jgi:hypothetical protein